MKKQKVNHLAVWLLVILFQVNSVLWFSPWLFAGKWMGYLGRTIAVFRGESVSGISCSFIGALTCCYLFAGLFKKLGIESGRYGAGLGLLIAIGCFVLQTLTQDSFQLRPLGLSLINSGIVVINFALAGLVLGSWKKFQKQ